MYRTTAIFGDAKLIIEKTKPMWITESGSKERIYLPFLPYGQPISGFGQSNKKLNIQFF
jgi:hypothetical protein